MDDPTVRAEPLRDALARADAAPEALLALGIPLCPSCELLEASLDAIARSRPDLTVAIAALASPDEWAAREELLWPRGIHVSRASIPVLVLLRDGEVVASRQGGGPASVIDEWLSERLGRARAPIGPELTLAERSRLETVEGLRTRHLAAKASRQSG